MNGTQNVPASKPLSTRTSSVQSCRYNAGRYRIPPRRSIPRSHQVHRQSHWYTSRRSSGPDEGSGGPQVEATNKECFRLSRAASFRCKTSLRCIWQEEGGVYSVISHGTFEMSAAAITNPPDITDADASPSHAVPRAYYQPISECCDKHPRAPVQVLRHAADGREQKTAGMNDPLVSATESNAGPGYRLPHSTVRTLQAWPSRPTKTCA